MKRQYINHSQDTIQKNFRRNKPQTFYAEFMHSCLRVCSFSIHFFVLFVFVRRTNVRAGGDGNCANWGNSLNNSNIRNIRNSGGSLHISKNSDNSLGIGTSPPEPVKKPPIPPTPSHQPNLRNPSPLLIPLLHTSPLFCHSLGYPRKCLASCLGTFRLR